MANCVIDGCNHDSFMNETKCALHCEKPTHKIPYTSRKLLSTFHNQLLDHIIECVFPGKSESENINREQLKQHLNEGHRTRDFPDQDLSVFFDNISFPHTEIKDRHFYIKILNKLGEIHFKNCSFSLFKFESQDTKCFFEQCTFLASWDLSRTNILDNQNKVLYQDCTFNKIVSATPEFDNKLMIQKSLFSDCDFKSSVEFYDVVFIEPVFKNISPKALQIDKLVISNCELRNRFITSYLTINEILIENTIFKDKFEFKHNHVKRLVITNSNFEKIADLYDSSFSMFTIKKSIFDDFVGFEECSFGDIDDNDTKYLSSFIYATFLSFVNFRNTNFKSGLDIKNINLKEPPNFLNTVINPTNSNRETFRIIKNSFDKNGNFIEGNKFFVLEMNKYKEELSDKKLSQEKLMLWFNDVISGFGQSYLKPISWIFALSVIYTLLTISHESNYLYKIFPPANDYIQEITKGANTIATNILPFEKFLREGMELISLLFYILFSSLIWQTIVSIKRKTKR